MLVRTFGFAILRWMALCQMTLCAMFFTGCGRSEPESGMRKIWDAEPVQMNIENSERQTVDGAETAEPSAKGNTAKEILRSLTKDAGFRKKVWYDADIHDDDTEETILQKLKQCENLTLGEPPYGKETFSLEDLRLLPNLKSLTIRFSEFNDFRISDFSPIAGLSQLERLYISYPAGEEMDLSFLSEMDTLTELYLCECQLRDFAFLGEMVWLERLSLYGTPINDLAVLENLTELKELSLAKNAGADHIETVGKLLKMEDLGLQECGIREMGFLSGLKELRGVNLNNNSITDLTPLTGLSRLERLGLAGNEIGDITPIAGLSELFDLSLDENRIEDISALTGLSHLNQLGLSDNQIQDLSPLAEKKELLYLSVYGNPCTDLEPVIQVPLLYFGNGVISDRQLETVADWMKEHRPNIEEYSCIDYAEKDLNGDGMPDAAFVVNGDFREGDGIYAANDERRLFVILRQEDGSWKETDNVLKIADPYSGGMRGDPYRGILMGEGCLLIKGGWGSSTGETQTDIYRYRQGRLELSQSIAVSDSNFAYGYDVTVNNEDDGTRLRYVIAMDGYRMVRVDLEDSGHPAHRAFPELELFTESYLVYREKKNTSMDAMTALDSVLHFLAVDAVRESLPYASWQKEGYELLKGVELPDYFYVIGSAEKTAEEETQKQTDLDYIYYKDLTASGGAYFHVVCYVKEKRKSEYWVNDSTGEIIIK